MHGLRLPQLVVEEPHAVLDLANLAHKPANTQWSNMKHVITSRTNVSSCTVPVVGRVPAGLYLRPRGPEREPGLRHLEGRPHAADGGRQLLHVLLLVEDLLRGAGQVRAQAGVRALVQSCKRCLTMFGMHNAQYNNKSISIPFVE